jgi:hypothetical protein
MPSKSRGLAQSARKPIFHPQILSKSQKRARVYEAVRLTLLEDRICTVDVVEVPEGTPVLIGQIPLEMLDVVVHPQGRRLTGNPAHNGEQMLELF